MEVGSFQFLTSLLEFVAALNFGFVATDYVIEKAKSSFSNEIKDWIKLQNREPSAELSDSELAVDEFVEDCKKNAEALTDGILFRRRVEACIALFSSLLIALLPLPVFAINLVLLAWSYFIVWLLIIIALIRLFYDYKKLQKYWNTKKDEIPQLIKNTLPKDIAKQIVNSNSKKTKEPTENSKKRISAKK